MFLTVSDAPHITQAPRSAKVADEGVVSFFCKASGNPPPVITWRKKGREIPTAKYAYVVFCMCTRVTHTPLASLRYVALHVE